MPRLRDSVNEWTDSHSRYMQIPIVAAGPVGSDGWQAVDAFNGSREAEGCSEIEEGAAAAAKAVGTR